MSPAVSLVVDSREPQSVRNALSELEVRHEQACLDVGDFHVVRDGRLLLTLERKTWSDLENARVSGRFDDQLVRALANGCDKEAMHFIVLEDARVRSNAELRDERTSNSGLMASSAINRCILQKGVGVFRTADTRDTAHLLKWIIKKCETESVLIDNVAGNQYGKRGIGCAKGPYYGGVIHAKKSKNQDSPIACWVNMLTVIRGLSENAARSISDHYSDALMLFQAAQSRKQSLGKGNLVTHATDLLSQVAIKNSKRKVGHAVAKRVTACLFASA
ncbi:hypothetical protein CYMTET_10812 [Cymbomonas tetramitiformis]|uniref:Crossover junction endonuclease MUS81 n=1 Tax=Cymbomonas tetramitiformis TaxID=36881 RepID=A0AAE0GNR6_9CHLO|nr:hypothetical protein CYMTET_55149 [Cymbomonas tetramitiformis]KAK3281397.1 hypothetical protein CYMTET_10812 [Cymbomonas tetramitiformis]